MEALLRVGRAVATTDPVTDVLLVIADEACSVARAQSASIVLLAPGNIPHLAVSTGLSEDYNSFLDSHVANHRRGLSQDALDQRAPIVIEDIESDPRVIHSGAREWGRFALRENYRAALSVPLMLGGQPLGALNVYRAEAGRWAPETVEVLAFFASHAANAINRATLIDSQRRQVDALERVVTALRGQTQEYAHQLQALSGLLATESVDEAQAFLANLMVMHHANANLVVDRLHHPIVAGLVLALTEAARRRHVEVRLHRASRLESLPAALVDAETVSIIANLVVNAVEAAAGLPRLRRRVSLRITQTRDAVHIAVRDWGRGLPGGTSSAIFSRGTSSKPDHPGVGLALVSDAVAAAHGKLTVRSHKQGTTFQVILPYQPSR
jgi:signal transduction histidine kinase